MDQMRLKSCIPVAGIAEAGIIEAASDGRRFSVVTTTPGLILAIHERVAKYGYEALLPASGLRKATLSD
ncbi:aspartate/glutamate racemase family protein [Mesorhizobium sp. M0306]|uniref:aspartate/glutamate racemase family protein n=1 Tax=Mesorhizobium sp. M0306 TaxID=2956932 RepID=UPI003334E269